jgi:hypothetical protein
MKKGIFLFLFLVSNFLYSGIKIKNYEIKGENLKFKVNIDKEGIYFLKFEGTLPENILNEGVGYLVKIGDKEILHKQGWDEGYIPTFIPVNKKGKYFEFIYTVPLNLKKGENEISFYAPSNLPVSSFELLESIDSNMKKDVNITGTNFVFFKNEKPVISFSLTSDKDKKLDSILLSYFVILSDDKGEGSWAPGNRFIAKEVVLNKKIIIELKKNEKMDFSFEMPNDKYGTFSSFLVLKEKDKILPLHILNYSIVFERDTENFNYNGLFMVSAGDNDIKFLKALKKIGIDWVRYEVGWNGFEPKKGEFRWYTDKFMNGCRESKIYVMTLTEGAPEWAKPKGDFFNIPYKDFKIKLDWSPGREFYDDWKNAWYEYGKRYIDINKAFNVWNEPWEGGGISGWKSTGQHYRNLFKKVREARDMISSDIKIVGADSSHNTNWKIFAGGMEKDIDVLSTHYELPIQACYSPSLANYYKKEVWDTETWITWMGDSATVRNLLNEISLGWKKLSPFLTKLIFDKDGFPNTSTAWTSTLSRFLNNKEFTGFAHPERPPFVLIFKGEKENVAVVSTSLCGVYQWMRNVFWGQFCDDKPTMIIKNIPDLKIYDIYGNQVKFERKDNKVYIPVDKNPKYIVSKINFENFLKILKEADYQNLRPCEIFVHQIGKENELMIDIKNVYNSALKGKLIIKSKGLEFEKDNIDFVLSPLEKRSFKLKIKNADLATNNFPSEIIVKTDKGEAKLKENLVFCVIKRGKIVVDGNIDEWKEIKAMPIILIKGRNIENLTLKAWYPWENFIKETGEFACEVSFAYDDEFLYGMARVKDKTKNILPSLLSGKNLHKFQNPPGDYVYAEIGPIPASSGDMIKISLGNIERKKWIKEYEVFPPDSPLYRFGHYISGLYQYLIYPTDDGKAEIMRTRTPDFYYLHPLPIDYKFLSEKCKVENSKVIVERSEDGYIYEFAIPWNELSEIRPDKNKRIRLSFEIQNGDMGNVIEFSENKSICSVNTLDFEPGWGTKWTSETEFEFSE